MAEPRSREPPNGPEYMFQGVHAPEPVPCPGNGSDEGESETLTQHHGLIPRALKAQGQAPGGRRPRRPARSAGSRAAKRQSGWRTGVSPVWTGLWKSVMAQRLGVGLRVAGGHFAPRAAFPRRQGGGFKT